MGVLSGLSDWYDQQTAKLRPGYNQWANQGNVPAVSMDTNQAGATDLSRRIQAAVGKFIIGRHPAARQIIKFLTVTEMGAKLHMDNANRGDMAEGLAEEQLGITYDPYTESILAEVESSQQTERKLESASSFIRPKKKKKLLYE